MGRAPVSVAGWLLVSGLAGCFTSSTGGLPPPSDSGSGPPPPPACGDGSTDPGEACDDGNTNDGDWCSAACDQAWGVDAYDPSAAGQVDVLFVIDNSGSMCEEQLNLQASFPAFADALVAAGGVDFHIGVITTDTMDPAQGGALQNLPRPPFGSEDCLVPPPPPLDCTTGLPSPLPRILTPITADLSRTFGCIASVGIEGFGGESALAAIELALSPPLAAPSGLNAGFLRESSFLAIVIVGDEDDCSVCMDPEWPGQCQFLPSMTQNLDCSIWQNEFLTPVTTFVDAVRLRKPPGRILVSAVIGRDASGLSGGPLFPDPDTTNHPDELFPICESEAGRAVPAPRLEEFASAFAPLAAGASICEPDFAAPLADLGTRVGVIAGAADWCLRSTPCSWVTPADVRISYLDAAGAVVEVDPADYSLVPNPSCPGGLVVDFATPPPSDAVVFITYPMISPAGVGC